MRLAVLPAFAALALSAACGGASGKKSVRANPATLTEATVSYAAELGGLPKLIAAAKKEGRLCVIGLPTDWANYGQLMEAFTATYGIAVSQDQPGASSVEEIRAARQLRGGAAAPDVFDLDPAVALANTALLAPYKVTNWGDIPDAIKDAGGAFAGAYAGFASIGYDPARVPRPRSVADLLGPRFHGAVALHGDPRRSGAGLYGTIMAALDSGGTADDITAGVQFFADLKRAGNASPAAASTVLPGQSPVVIDWDYNNVQHARRSQGSAGWQVVVPKAAVGLYHAQAVNKNAPHPAAARLWAEFVLSDVGQNLLLRSYVRPARADAMRRAGTIDRAYWDALPALHTSPVFLTPAQVAKATATIAANWGRLND